MPQGYLDGKEKDDCDRYVREVVQVYLDERPFTQKDEQAIRTAVHEMVELKLAHHESQCAKTRSKSGYFATALIISILAMLSSLGMLIVMLYKGFSG